jgi:hypothetical protein
MKVTKISYKRVFALPNYQNEQVGIELELEEGENVSDAFDKAKRFVMAKSENGLPATDEILKARAILLDPDHHTVAEYRKAQELINKLEQGDDLPF